jgi:hypothetical protein
VEDFHPMPWKGILWKASSLLGAAAGALLHDDGPGSRTARHVADHLDAHIAAHLAIFARTARRGRDGRAFWLELMPEEWKEHRLSPQSGATRYFRRQLLAPSNSMRLFGGS